MTKAETKRIIDQAWWAIERALGGGEAASYFIKARDVALEHERAHRRMGARFTRGQASYKFSADYAARYFACKWFLDWEARMPRTWADAMSFRADAQYAWAARDLLRAYEPDGSVKDSKGLDAYNDLVSNFGADLGSIDYATHIAERAA